MTNIQSLMLAVSFGAVIGTFIGNLVSVVRYAIADHKRKKRKQKDNDK